MPKALQKNHREEPITRSKRSAVLRAVNIKNGGTFEEEYARLNTAQKRAVDAVEGPILVVAGPGTGKTQVLALRTANILRKTQMRPSNILCLTFSKSGATAMRERLRILIGPDAYGVTVNTIHGFSNDIVTHHPQVFSDWDALEQISDVERYRLVNGIIDELMPSLTLLSRKMPYRRTRDILGRIAQLKREGKTDKGELLAVADAYDAAMQKKSREGTKAHAKNVASAKKFRELLEIFFRYQEALKDSGRYDYEDMILTVIAALKEEDWLRASLQERYQYILVDEFQDTNGSQYELLELLTSDPTPDQQPNIFVVGDDDQAIYRFQGANLQNILSFKNRFQDVPVIVLTESYRCSQSILDAAQSLIAHNTERLVSQMDGLSKDLVAARKAAADAAGSAAGITAESPMLLSSPTDTLEPFLIADLVEERIEHGVQPQEIAILVQTNRELPSLERVLTARDIPVNVVGKGDLLSHPLVAELLTILRAVLKPQDSSLLGAALACTCFSCHPADVGRLNLARREAKGSLMDTLLRSDDLPDALRLARDTLLDLHQKLPSRTVIDTLEHVLRNCGLLPTMEELRDGTVDPKGVAALQEFFAQVVARAEEQPHFALSMLLADIAYYLQPEYGDLRLTYALPHMHGDGVQLMTAHQSKGREFDTVILSNFRDKHWDRRRRPASVAMPEDLLFGWEKVQKDAEKHQDERRVAYVAMTRARNELLFTCPKELSSEGALQAVSPSGFFAEAGDLTEEERPLRDPTTATTLLLPPPRVFDDAWKTFLRDRIEHFALSVTALNRFLHDPLHFLDVDLLMMPQASNATFAYGNAVHDALAKWGTSVQQGRPLSKEHLLEVFCTYMKNHEILTDAERVRLLHLGEEALPRYYDEVLTGTLPIVYKVESPLRARLGDIPLKGKIDRIDLRSPESAVATIVDYKTGHVRTEKQVRDGDAMRQLVFYALLLEHSGSPLQPEKFVLDFIGEGSEEPKRLHFTVSEEEKKELYAVIEAVWSKIVALDFTVL